MCWFFLKEFLTTFGNTLQDKSCVHVIVIITLPMSLNCPFKFTIKNANCICRTITKHRSWLFSSRGSMYILVFQLKYLALDNNHFKLTSTTCTMWYFHNVRLYIAFLFNDIIGNSIWTTKMFFSLTNKQLHNYPSMYYFFPRSLEWIGLYTEYVPSEFEN